MFKNLIENRLNQHLVSAPLSEFESIGFEFKGNQYSGCYKGFNCDAGYDPKFIVNQFYWIRVFVNYDSNSEKELHKLINKLEKNTNRDTSYWTFTSVNLYFPSFFKRPSFEVMKIRLDNLILILEELKLKSFTMCEANEKIKHLEK
jgi:hypothetical protein